MSAARVARGEAPTPPGRAIPGHGTTPAIQAGLAELHEESRHDGETDLLVPFKHCAASCPQNKAELRKKTERRLQRSARGGDNRGSEFEQQQKNASAR